MKRTVESELLDSDGGTPAEIAAALSDIRRVNRWFGGVSTSEHLVRRVVDASGLRRFELLDVGSGSGDVPLAIASRLDRRGVHLHPTLLDRCATHLPCVPSTIVGDALNLPFPPESFDLVTCSLFAHHLEPALLQHFVREALRVARIALVINDLVRTRLHLALVMAGRLYFAAEWHGRMGSCPSDAPTPSRRCDRRSPARVRIQGAGGGDAQRQRPRAARRSWSPARARRGGLGLGTDDFVLLCVERVLWEKNVQLLLDALREVARRAHSPGCSS